MATERNGPGRMAVHLSHPRWSAEGLRIAIWGTGTAARLLRSHLRRDVVVVTHVDNDPVKWGTEFEGVTVCPPASLSAHEFDVLLLATHASEAILADLPRLGIPAHVPALPWTGRHDGWRAQALFPHPLFAALQVGITTRCNLRCNHCPRDTDESVYRDLDIESFQRYLEAFDPAQFHSLLVSDFGEVTLVRQFLEYLRVARHQGWEGVEFVTNATNPRRELWETIFRERLASKITVSLEGTGDAFEAVRGFPWARFSTNVSQMVALNRAHGSPVEFVFNVVCMKSNLAALGDVVDFAAEHGARLSFVHLNPCNLFNNPLGDASNHLDTADRAEVVAAFRDVLARAARLGVAIQLPEDFPELAAAPSGGDEGVAGGSDDGRLRQLTDALCTQPFRWVEVDDAGNVYPCCQMAKRHAVGNLRASTFESLWADEGYVRLLEGLKPGGVPLDVCRECNMYRGKRF